jgi:flavin reductase (DIM6/NTAB) family NADH-FMN oxidoreductase RutF
MILLGACRTAFSEVKLTGGGRREEALEVARGRRKCVMDVAQIGQVYAQLDPPIWLVTAADGGRRGGFIATTVAQASIVDVMPRQLITVNQRHHTHELIEASGAFAMHLIDETQLDLIWRFGLQSGRDVDKLAGLTFHAGATGSPLLADAVAWLDCRVESRMDSGDRTIYLAGVVDGRLQRAGPPLTNRRFFAIAPPDKQRILSEQYDRDARLDAAAIQRWRDRRGGLPVPDVSLDADLERR